MRRLYSGNEYRSILVCVDSYEDYELRGHFHHQASSGVIVFKSMMQLLLEIERLLDEKEFPQSFTAKRCFQELSFPQNIETEELWERRGRKASFIIKVLFRQNATWQGSITWVDEGREESFRSALELLLLMHSVLWSDK